MDKPSVHAIMEAARISRTHAYDILGERVEPSLQVALKIFDKTGAQFGVLTGLPANAIERIRAEHQRRQAA